jgi:hypothetical protein
MSEVPPPEPSEDAGGIDGLLDQVALFVGSLLRTGGLVLFKPRHAAARLLADGSRGERRYSTPMSFLIVGATLSAFGTATYPGGEQVDVKVLVGWVTDFAEAVLQAMEFDELVFQQLALAGLIAAGVFAVARLWERTAPPELRRELRATTLYALMGGRLVLFPVTALVIVTGKLGLPDAAIGALALGLAVYGMAIAPWIVLASWARANLSGARRTLNTLGPGLLVPCAWLGIAAASQPLSEAFDAYETSKIWLTSTAAPVLGADGLYTMQMEGQLDLSEPASLGRTQLCPDPDRPSEGPPAECIHVYTNRDWLPAGDTFELELYLELAPGLDPSHVEGWMLCRDPDSAGCFSGFRFPSTAPPE